MPERNWLTRDSLLLCLSAFFADMGYQAVSAIFPVFLVLELKQPAYIYGLLLAVSYGLGSFWSFVGGKLGDRYSKKVLSITGNLLIPLMSFSVLFGNVAAISSFFIFGWWGRYFRTPTRRAWLVEVTDPDFRAKVFGFLHALDIGGGIIAVAYSILLLLLNYPIKAIMLITSLPLFVSTFLLIPAGVTKHPNYEKVQNTELKGYDEENEKSNSRLFRLILISATLFGFSYYSFGFPIITVAESRAGELLAILSFGLYLSVSAVSGYVLGSARRLNPLSALWGLGYAIAAVSSAVLGISYLLRYSSPFYMLGAAGLGFATGAIETFEPVLVSLLGRSRSLSGRMGWLSSSRAIGLFVSNSMMGLLFQLSQFDSYMYAAITSLVAALILIYGSLTASVKAEREFEGSKDQ
ncbi:MAG: MFS transporter [Conexivisphaerales archaeon]